MKLLLDMISISSGKFLMGAAKDDYADDDEKPQREVHLSAFSISRDPITVRQWNDFLQATQYDWPLMEKLLLVSAGDDYPAVYISWLDACAFLEWLADPSDNVSLPTEAQWERACRGLDGRLFAWGNDVYEVPFQDYEYHLRHHSIVGSFPNLGSACGCRDMGGNIYEWCQDWYDDDLLETMSDVDPQGPPIGLEKSLRGGSIATTTLPHCYHRSHGRPQYRHEGVGFRIVLSP
jgi:formylglycine-generating enzyme required for sulfatase activity